MQGLQAAWDTVFALLGSNSAYVSSASSRLWNHAYNLHQRKYNEQNTIQKSLRPLKFTCNMNVRHL